MKKLRFMDELSGFVRSPDLTVSMRLHQEMAAWLEDSFGDGAGIVLLGTSFHGPHRTSYDRIIVLFDNEENFTFFWLMWSQRISEKIPE